MYAANRLDEAEPLLRRALEMRERSCGPDHPQVATALNNLAALLRDSNRPGEAEPLAWRGLQILVEFQLRTGHVHPHLLDFVHNYGGILEAMGKTPAQVEQRWSELIPPLSPEVS